MVKGNYIQARQLKILECCHDHLDTTIGDMSALRRYCAQQIHWHKKMFHARCADDTQHQNVKWDGGQWDETA